MWQLMREARPYRRAVIVLALLALVQSASALALPWLGARVLDTPVERGYATGVALAPVPGPDSGGEVRFEGVSFAYPEQGGQGQRIALARALLKDARIYVLDEATSMYDATGELRFVEHCAQALAGKTLIIIAHRPVSLGLVSRTIAL
ncbi:MAG: hypothetical protein B7Y36_09015 [Novosphingobium sp. 28-62-57]|nr:MAG: hypothetical protein B7Y36_09015 [Novosphingobium sp. 28-62-57]OZA37174.1 MAG: hypothetical protein B7X92_05215 [Novosphingobium sp. 17-62-9]